MSAKTPSEMLDEIIKVEKGKKPASLDELIRKIDKAILDEEEAWKMYDEVRTGMVTIFPVGSAEYNIFVRIVGDEMRHKEELSRIRNALISRR